jgi:hypothetical protein
VAAAMEVVRQGALSSAVQERRALEERVLALTERIRDLSEAASRAERHEVSGCGSGTC